MSYNGLFKMTSFGCHKVDVHGWQPTLRVKGQVHHRIGALLPTQGSEANFLQIYFLDPDQQLTRRMSLFDNTRRPVILGLQDYFTDNNRYVEQFKNAVQILRENPHTNLKVNIIIIIITFSIYYILYYYYNY